MRSSHLPFKISSLLISFILLFSAQNIFAQPTWKSTFENNPNLVTKLVPKNDSTFFGFCHYSKFFQKSTDGGVSWNTVIGFDSNYTILDGSFINQNIGWIIGYNWDTYLGVVFKTTNGGTNWIKQSVSNQYSTGRAVYFLNENTGWLGLQNSAGGILLATTDGGQNWSKSVFSGVWGISRIKFLDNDNGWILGFNHFLNKTTNGGINWIPITINNVPYSYNSDNDFFPIDMDSGFALVTSFNTGLQTSSIMKTSNGGNNWNLMFSYTDNLTSNSRGFDKINFINSQTGYINGEFNFLFKTTNGGFNWNQVNTNCPLLVSSLLFLNETNIIAGGGPTQAGSGARYNMIIKSTNSGINWSIKDHNWYLNFSDVYFKDLQNGLAVADTGYIFKTTNGGTNWNKLFKNSSIGIRNFNYIDENILCGIGSGGKIYRTTNFGNDWNQVQPSSIQGINDLKIVNSEIGFASGSNGVALKTSDGGQNWFNLAVPIASDYSCTGIDFINENTGWVIANKVGGAPPFFYQYYQKIIKTTNGGNEWSVVMDNTNATTVFSKLKFSDANNGYLINYNSIAKTTDAGATWNSLGSNSNINYSTIKALNPNVWLAGGKETVNGNYRGAIYKTTNAGLSWNMQFSENGTSVYGSGVNSLFKLDSMNVWFCGDMNAIFKSTNGGNVFVSQISSIVPEGFSLKQNFPNPFNPTTKINFDLKNAAFAMLRVYDITGREVRTLVYEKLTAGSYSYDFNAIELPSGVYFYQLQADGFVETKKMILLK